MSASIPSTPSVGQLSTAVGNAGVANGMSPDALAQLRPYFRDPASAESDSVGGVLSYLNAQRQAEQAAALQQREAEMGTIARGYGHGGDSSEGANDMSGEADANDSANAGEDGSPGSGADAGDAGDGDSGDYARGGLVGYARGGVIQLAGGGKIARGPGGGLDDLIPTSIDGQQVAALSDGEFVVPSDVVSMMGDGSSSEGARRLYDLMKQIRQEKTGRPEQSGPLDVARLLDRSS